MKLKVSEKGQALVEFAIILPILLLLLGPMIDLGRAIYAKTQLQNITSDLLHMTILENEYSYQGGSFRAIEDKILWENEGIGNQIADKYRGYLSYNIFGKFLSVEGLYKIEPRDIEQYIELSPTEFEYSHEGKYPKLLKRVPSRGWNSLGEIEELVYTQGYDQFGYDRDGYDVNGIDTNNFYAGSFESENYKDERWKLKGVETNNNFTKYRTVKVKIPYEMKNVTFMGRAIFGDSRIIESESSGIVFLGGDGRNVKDYK